MEFWQKHAFWSITLLGDMKGVLKAYEGVESWLRVLASRMLRAAKRLFKILDFRFSAPADGIRAYLFS